MAASGRVTVFLSVRSSQFDLEFEQQDQVCPLYARVTLKIQWHQTEDTTNQGDL